MSPTAAAVERLTRTSPKPRLLSPARPLRWSRGFTRCCCCGTRPSHPNRVCTLILYNNKISTFRRQLACCVTLSDCFALRATAQIRYSTLAIERRRQTATVPGSSFHNAVARVSSTRSVAFGRSTAVGPAFIATTVTTPALPTCPAGAAQRATQNRYHNAKVHLTSTCRSLVKWTETKRAVFSLMIAHLR